MARYRGPRIKVCRSLGTVLPGLTSVPTLARPFPPGQHGPERRNKPSDFKVRLIEKQKARAHFGVLEKQFVRYVSHAARMKGSTGLNLVRLLESRLDSMVWRLGLARTIPAARQLVVHGHIQVNGKRVDRPSFHVAPGSTISIQAKEHTKPWVQAALGEAASRTRPSWIEFDPTAVTGRLVGPPERSDLPFPLNENAIVEYYSQKL